MVHRFHRQLHDTRRKATARGRRNGVPGDPRVRGAAVRHAAQAPPESTRGRTGAGEEPAGRAVGAAVRGFEGAGGSGGACAHDGRSTGIRGESAAPGRSAGLPALPAATLAPRQAPDRRGLIGGAPDLDDRHPSAPLRRPRDRERAGRPPPAAPGSSRCLIRPAHPGRLGEAGAGPPPVADRPLPFDGRRSSTELNRPLPAHRPRQRSGRGEDVQASAPPAPPSRREHAAAAHCPPSPPRGGVHPPTRGFEEAFRSRREPRGWFVSWLPTMPIVRAVAAAIVGCAARGAPAGRAAPRRRPRVLSPGRGSRRSRAAGGRWPRRARRSGSPPAGRGCRATASGRRGGSSPR